MIVRVPVACLFILFYFGGAWGIHQESHCGNEWITFQAVGYSIGEKYTAYPKAGLATFRKSDIENILGGEGRVKVNLKNKNVAVAYYVMPDSREALLRCLDL